MMYIQSCDKLEDDDTVKYSNNDLNDPNDRNAYDLNDFKSRINKALLTVGAF